MLPPPPSSAGWELGPYLVSPIAALLVLVLVFLVGRELGLPRGWAAAAAVVLAACPVFVFQAIQPMSDVVATAWCLAAIFAALRSRARRPLGSGGGLRFWCGRSRAAPRRARGCAASFCAAHESSSLGPLPRGRTAVRGGSLRLRHRVFRQPFPDRIRPVWSRETFRLVQLSGAPAPVRALDGPDVHTRRMSGMGRVAGRPPNPGPRPSAPVDLVRDLPPRVRLL